MNFHSCESKFLSREKLKLRDNYTREIRESNRPREERKNERKITKTNTNFRIFHAKSIKPQIFQKVLIKLSQLSIYSLNRKRLKTGVQC